MSSQLSPENEAFIQQGIAAGQFASRDEALETGVTFLRERQRLLDRLDESRRQLDAGEFTEYDDQSLRTFFEDVKAQVQARDEDSVVLAMPDRIPHA